VLLVLSCKITYVWLPARMALQPYNQLQLAKCVSKVALFAACQHPTVPPVVLATFITILPVLKYVRMGITQMVPIIIVAHAAIIALHVPIQQPASPVAHLFHFTRASAF